MKIHRVLFVITAFTLLICGLVTSQGADAKKAKKAKLRHVVSFKFEESATSDQIKKVEAAFADLPSKITKIDKLE